MQSLKEKKEAQKIMLNNMKVKTKILGVFAIMIAINIIFVVLACLEVNKQGNTTLVNVFILFGICIVVFGTLSAWILLKTVLKPIGEIVAATDSLAEGNVEVEVDDSSTNEYGHIMKSIKKLADGNKAQAEIAHLLSQGDLTIDVKPKSEHDLLGKAISELVTDNNEAMLGIKESTMQVTTGAEQVANASQALAQGSTEQASAIEQITTSMEEIAEKTKINASQANNAASLVHEVKSGAVKGDAQMQEMMNAMREINESSESISKVIKVIDDIAFQTNILALNATVEAARAGVHGKGFAVVAEEVRNLAEKSAAAASETDEMIETSIHKVRVGSSLAEDTAKALGAIMEAIDKIVELIDGIANASGEQATAVTQINQAIEQVSQVVQTNSATSEQCASASEELANQAEALRDLIGKYRLKDGSDYKKKSYAARDNSYKSKTEYNYNDNERIISLDGGYGKY